MMNNFYRDTWVEIDLDALKHNYEQLVALRPNQQMIAVIKANGYGHGDLQMARLYSELGVAYLAVSSLDEGLKLRRHGIKTPIIVLAPVKITDTPIAATANITLIAYDEQWVLELATVNLPKQLTLHLEVETGMNRIGLRNAQAAYEQLCQIPNVETCGIYTHIASADSNLVTVAEQITTFSQIIKAFDPDTFKFIHVANTPMTLQYDIPATNAHRVGLGLYGLNPAADFIKTSLNLRPAFKMFSRLTQISKLNPGDAVSYGGTFVADTRMHVGTMSVGYADGWLRTNQGRNVVIKGYECEIIGRVCMDQMMVKLPSDDFAIGDPVVLIGDEMPVTRVATELDTIPYEVLTLISDRIPRIYKNIDGIVDINLGRFF